MINALRPTGRILVSAAGACACVLAAAVFAMIAESVHAAGESRDPGICPLTPTGGIERPEPFTDAPIGTVIAEADSVKLVQDDTSLLSGNVLIRRGTEFVETDSLEFNSTSGELKTLAPARFGDADITINAERVEYNTNLGTGTFEGVDFLIPSRPARGGAEEMKRLNETESELYGVTYTTCPPDDEDWVLRATSMDIDQQSGRGTARNVRLALGGVPVLYVPWLQFPIDDRRMTGLLFPTFGSSELSGEWLQVPVYFNIAENYDATLAPLFSTRRGTRMDGQFRYLWGWGQGEINAEYLPEDDVTGETRHMGHFRHISRFGESWNAILDYRDVSDPEYLQDFSEDGRATASSFIASTFSLSSAGLDYGFRTTFRRYDSVDPSLAPGAGPYEQWPAIELSYMPLPLWGMLNTNLEMSAINFRKDASIEGWRQHVEPALSVDFGNPGFRVTPRVALAHTRYELDRPDGSSLELDRTLPVASVDSQWIFERTTASGGTQTLEPRIFLLSVPYRDQSNIPIFDTRRPTPTLDNLYQYNRFPGLDRYGDARQATLGMDNHWYAPGRIRPWLSFRIAQALYFEDRRVALGTSEPPDTDSTSDLFTELQYAPSESSNLRLTTSWDDQAQKINIGSLQYQYRPAERTVMNLSYSFRRDISSSATTNEPLRQASFSFATPLGNRWKLFGKTIHSFSDEQSLENLAGLEYESCCWSFRVFNRRYIFNREGDFNQALWLQLTLKGMGSVGRRADEFLAEDIRGYGEPQ